MDDEVARARRCTWVGFWVNAALAITKIVGGVLGRSAALLADGIHSLSDFISDIIVIVMVGVARRKPDEGHQFGHGRYEALATILLAIVLAIVAVGIFWSGIESIIEVANGGSIPTPSWYALIIILASIASKEWLFHYTRRVGRAIHSDAVIANAWHHRSDAFSSVATLIGVAGAFFLGPKWHILDPVAAMIVAIFIIMVSIQLARPAMGELLGASLPESDLDAIEKAVNSAHGVRSWHRLRTFKSGNDAYVELHIKVDPEINVRDAHSIATDAEGAIACALKDRGLNAHVNTHIEPAKD